MANFEGLIRQALAKQDSGNPVIRERIYQSSRAALERMVANKGNVPSDVAGRQQEMLEQSIRKIESEFKGNQPQSARPAVPTPPQVDEITKRFEPPSLSQTSAQSVPDQRTVEAPEPVLSKNENDWDGVGESDNLENEPDLTSRYKTRRRVIKSVGLIGLLAIVGLVGYVSYLLIAALIDKNTNDQPQNREVNRVSALNPVDGKNANSNQYITLLEPNDPSAIVMDGAGQAKIVNDVEETVLQIISVRPRSDKSSPAKPILLEIRPGILSQISGKKITVEILAKSGSSGPATFSIECQFGEIGSCGRKRFRVGLQPEAVVFAIEVNNADNVDNKAYLAIRTDIASSANLTGRGDILDIVSARLRIVGQN